MHGTQVGFVKESNQASLGCFLERTKGLGLEPKVDFEAALCNLTDKPLEKHLSIVR
jgi:hypothetical protein